jgi:Zn-finger nucleic acid-binding protein
MPNCTNCSAPLPANSIKCAYCGSKNDLDLKGVHYHTTTEPEQPRICPRCNVALKTIDLQLQGTFLVERCDQCLGIFFDPGELEALLDATVTNVYTINRTQLNSLNELRAEGYSISYVKCPVCSQLMNRANYGTRSGVIVDRCKEHGVWLDGGELRQLAEWMKAGGKLLAEEEQRQKDADQARELRRAQAQVPLGGGGYPAGDDGGLFGGTMRHGDPDLLDVVITAVRYFLK